MTLMSSINVSNWWYPGIALLGLTAGLAFYVLYKEHDYAVARKFLIMSIWLPIVIWGIFYAVVMLSVASSVPRGFF